MILTEPNKIPEFPKEKHNQSVDVGAFFSGGSHNFVALTLSDLFLSLFPQTLLRKKYHLKARFFFFPV